MLHIVRRAELSALRLEGAGGPSLTGLSEPESESIVNIKALQLAAVYPAIINDRGRFSSRKVEQGKTSDFD